MRSASIFLILLGFFIAFVGGFFTYLMWKSYERADAMHDWPQAEAVVLSSAVEEWQHDEYSPMEYRLDILYGYQWEGESRTGDRLTFRGNPFSNKASTAEGLMEKFPQGKKIKVYINPADANFAIIKPDSKAAGYSIWFPMLFVVGGLGIVIRAVMKMFPKKSLH